MIVTIRLVVLIVILVLLLSPILFTIFSLSRISNDDLAEWHKGLESKVRRDMGIKKNDEED